MRPDGSNAITGFMTQITLTGGFANKTLFDQAGVPCPAQGDLGRLGRGRQARWPKASRCRSRWRSTAPAIASPARTSPIGANYIGADGKPAPLDEGAKDFITKLVGWTDDGTMSKDVWVSAAGTTYRPAAEDFINGQLVFYYSGSWQVPNFAPRSATNFDWVATGSPCGPAACTGMPGGAGLVAVKYTKNPKEVAQGHGLSGAAKKIVKEFSERTLFLPAHKGVVASGLDFKTDDAQVKAALDAFVAASATTADSPRKCRAGAGPTLLWRARHPRRPGDGRRTDARGGLPAHRRRTSRQGQGRGPVSGDSARWQPRASGRLPNGSAGALRPTSRKT